MTATRLGPINTGPFSLVRPKYRPLSCLPPSHPPNPERLSRPPLATIKLNILKSVLVQAMVSAAPASTQDKAPKRAATRKTTRKVPEKPVAKAAAPKKAKATTKATTKTSKAATKVASTSAHPSWKDMIKVGCISCTPNALAHVYLGMYHR